jgi:homoserine O-succinyltransferase
VEQIPFEEVDYWPELCEIMEWSKTHVTSTLHICWGAQAGLYYHYGIPKYPLEKKLFGVYEHTLDYNRSMLFRGYDDVFNVPHSRHTTTKREDMEAIPDLRIMASSAEAGVFCAMTARGKQVYVMGHSEYDADTLKNEYLRDKNAGLPIQPPAHYFPDDDPTRDPIVRWRSCANLFYSNWLNYYVYQTTPYDLDKI